ncbi:diguanylate cyclase [Oscillibacter sp.]|uniref:GGDEF domain-containing protein n=1 Tax=Oscillibacter sp. TaxID=1945593 RepID=UPI00260303F2|nr:GGDEF domain-containing protein [Oscillibacter sp.]MDD3347741.1 GGDEF domain-containing protein [Oscillibacter sp.]
MKKSCVTPCVVFVSSIFVIYLAIFWLSISNWDAVTLPEVVDGQMVLVQDAALISGGQRTKITLPDYFDVTGETRLQFTLDYAFSGRTVPSLILQANHTFMTILLDGEVLYRVEPRPYSPGNYFTRIPLPQKVSGGQLEIRVTVPANGLTHVSMPALTIANEAVFLRQQVLLDIPALLLNTLILFSGLILLVLALMARKSIDPYRMLLRGLLALNCGLYFMCETYCVVYLAHEARIVYLVDMLSFAMLGPSLLAVLGWELEDWRGKLLKRIAGVGMAAALAQLAVSLLSGIELRRLLPVTHAVQVVGILAIITCIAYGFICKKNNRSLYIGGLIALCGAVDLTLFLSEFWQNNVFFLKVGILAYLFHQMYQFVRLLMQHSAEAAREAYYKTLAMQDPLSHCYSRAAFDLDRSAWRGEAVRTAFFLDLNNLKATNDLYGHGAGDQLIHAFGGVLSRVFFSTGKCYRVGGDEFWVFCDDLAPGQAGKMVRTVQREVEAYNHDSDLPVKLSYAIGVCDTEETQGDLDRVIELADARMYENKRAVKQLMQF